MPATVEASGPETRKGRPARRPLQNLRISSSPADTEFNSQAQRLADRYRLSGALARLVLDLLREDQKHA